MCYAASAGSAGLFGRAAAPAVGEDMRKSGHAQPDTDMKRVVAVFLSKLPTC